VGWWRLRSPRILIVDDVLATVLATWDAPQTLSSFDPEERQK
jgi:hypothetical protein